MVGLMVAAIVWSLTAPQSQAAPQGRNIPLLAAIISVNAMSALDAVSTVYLVAHDYSDELNPVMNALMEHSYVLFFFVKLSITLGATIICWHYYERKRRARSILKLTSHVYSVLLAWHCLLLSSVSRFIGSERYLSVPSFCRARQASCLIWHLGHTCQQDPEAVL
jgi:hypothetical protein